MLEAPGTVAARLGKPETEVAVEIDQDDCNGCEVCVDRCQMEAITMNENIAVVDRNRCIGCGLCATGCTTGAARLMKKPDSELYTPPVSGAETYIRIAKERGKL